MLTRSANPSKIPFPMAMLIVPKINRYHCHSRQPLAARHDPLLFALLLLCSALLVSTPFAVPMASHAPCSCPCPGSRQPFSYALWARRFSCVIHPFSGLFSYPVNFFYLAQTSQPAGQNGRPQTGVINHSFTCHAVRWYIKRNTHDTRGEESGINTGT